MLLDLAQTVAHASSCKGVVYSRVLFSRRHRRSTAWLALLACLLQAAWPLIANASPYAQHILVEVCSAEGARQIAVENGASAPSPDAEHHLPHCAFCSIVAGKLAPPPVKAVPPVAGLVSFCTAATLPVAEIRESISIHAPDPRAPPVSL
jgi:hypothetical protein